MADIKHQNFNTFEFAQLKNMAIFVVVVCKINKNNTMGPKIENIEFDRLAKGAIPEHFGGSDYTYTNYESFKEDVEFSFIYNVEREEFSEMSLELTEEQEQKVVAEILDLHKENIDSNNAFETIDHYSEFSLNRNMFI